MRALSKAVAVCVILTGVANAIGCSSAEAPLEAGCVGSGSEALKTCAKGATIEGVDISVYQGTVDWAQIKGSGRTFAFSRISDGLHSPDSKFAQNWPAMKAAGIVRGSYQFFRPSQDASLQAQMVLDKLAAAGGLAPGDLPPVLDLETADGVSSSVVVAQAMVWLTKLETAIKAKPIVYTAAFMSDVIGNAFGAYTLWVANYGATCPTMPSGWTNWLFWQHTDSGSVPGISGNVDGDSFNGTLAELKALTLTSAVSQPSPSQAVVEVEPSGAARAAGRAFGAKPNDGSEGATLGSGTPSQQAQSAPITPCR